MNFFDRVLDLILKHRWMAFGIALAIGIVGGLMGRGLPTKLSLVELLPEERESVSDFRAVSKEFGGVGYLGIVLGPYDKNPEQFLGLAAEAAKKIPEIRYAFYERETYTLREKALYLIPQDEFEGVLQHTETLITNGKSGGLLDLGLGDADEDRAKVEEANAFFKKIRETYIGKDVTLEVNHQRYYLSKDGRYAVLWTKPSFDSENIAKSKLLLKNVSDSLMASLPKDVPFTFWGRYPNHVDDTEGVQKDIGLTSIVSLVGVAIVLIFGLGTVRGALITVLCMCLAMGWTLGFAKVMVGQINIVTGFLLAILGGLGVEYGIHLIRRYYQEIKAGKTHVEALDTSYKIVGRALFSAALTSSGAFFILSFSDFRGFSELGLIAGFGIIAIYCVYMLSFPAIAALLPKLQRFPKKLEAFGWYPFSIGWKWSLMPLAILAIWGVQKTYFEYDISKLQELSGERGKIDTIVRGIIPRSTTPAALLANSPEQAAALHDYLSRGLRKTAGQSDAVLEAAISTQSMAPPDMKIRHEKLSRFRRNLARIDDADLRKKTGIDSKLVRAWIQQEPYALQDLPINLWDGLGASGRIVLAYPKVDLRHFDGITQFSALLKDAKAQFPGIKIGSDVRIFDEILGHIVDDGRIVILMFLTGAFLVLWLDFRSVKEALALEVQLIAGIALLVALMGIFGVPFTILNVAMIPAVLAAGIDMGVHVRHRELESGNASLESARYVAQAVQLGALTSVIGFGSLFLAHASILKGIAWVSCLGQLSMYLICMFIWPLSKRLVTGKSGGGIQAGPAHSPANAHDDHRKAA